MVITDQILSRKLFLKLYIIRWINELIKDIQIIYFTELQIFWNEKSLLKCVDFFHHVFKLLQFLKI